MSISIYNTLTGKKEAFKPLLPAQVKMYCCGVTVYDLCHLGHARSYVVWDAVRRYLEWSGYQVQYVQNFTDIDDKILHRAKEENATMEQISARYSEAYFADMERLGVRSAQSYPRATEHIPQIIALISQLETKGLAYATQGDVYYRVRQFADYGQLSGRKLEDMAAGASGRVAEGEDSPKEDPCDFALWKAAKADEPAWDSPWGKGRPGWHIECSAMIDRAFAGTAIDIHCGGSDLIFPHHENEIAQSQGAHDHPLSRYWMHNGMVRVDGEKMSKSLGNFTTIRDLLDRDPEPVDPMVIRLFILTAHYRKPIDFTPAALATATASWQTLKTGLLFGEQFGAQLGWDGQNTPDLAGAPVATTPTVAPVVPPVPKSIDSPATPEILAPFRSLPGNTRQFIRANRGIAILAVLLFFTQFPIKFVASFLYSLNTVAILPQFFTSVGVAVTLRTLLWRQPRERFFGRVRWLLAYLFPGGDTPAAGAGNAGGDYGQRFREIVDEDFNFAGGLAVVFDLAKALGKQANILGHGGSVTADPQLLRHQWQTLQELAAVMGLTAIAPPMATAASLDSSEIEALIAQRQAARQAKNWPEADRLRDQLHSRGIELIDAKGQTTWRQAE